MSLLNPISFVHQIRFWDLESGRLLKTYEGNPADTWTIAFSPDSRFVATGSHTGCVNMIGIESGRKESAIQLDGKFIYSLAYVGFFLSPVSQLFWSFITARFMVIVASSP